MKKICIIGCFADDFNLLNGQTVKTKIIYKEMVKAFGCNEVIKIDTYGGLKTLFKSPILILNALRNCESVIILPAENGLRVIVPLLICFNKLFNRKLFYDVIGGWLPEFLFKRKWLSKLLKQFNCIFVETQSMKEQLDKQRFNNIEVIPNCKELKILKQEEVNFHQNEPLKLCTFSRVMKEKGIEEAVNAVVDVNNSEKRIVFTLDIFGQIDQNQIEWFDKLQNSFPNYINYSGVIPFDKSSIVLKDYFALLFPTFYEGEGFAGTLIDAMAAGVPVIASDWKYNKEIIKNWETGIIIERSLSEELSTVLSNKEKWMNMKSKCIEEAHRYLPTIALQPLINKLN